MSSAPLVVRVGQEVECPMCCEVFDDFGDGFECSKTGAPICPSCQFCDCGACAAEDFEP